MLGSIEFSNFSFQYESLEKPTLNNINLRIEKGEKIVIIGPSGSGKSTLGHCLNGLIPSAIDGHVTGSLSINGVASNTMKLHDFTEQIGTVLQDTDSQFVGLSVAEDIAFALENQLVPHNEMLETVRDTSQFIDLESLLHHSPHDLSGGQKQRVSLAGVMVDDVDLLLFDEPLASLDPKTGKRTIEIIDQIHRDTGKTIVIIEHRLEDVLHRSVDRVILMEGGEIIADMTPDTLLHSNLLIKHGIREPLYLAALKQANCRLAPPMPIANLSAIPVGSFQPELAKWMTFDNPITAPIRSKTLLKVDKLTFSYDGEKNALEDVSFEVKKGEFVSVLGKNGSGKSTLTKLIMGVLKPDSGSISMNDANMADLSIFERSQKVGVVMQNPNHMISHHMIFDEVAFGLRNLGLPEPDIEEKVSHVLELCGLKQYRHWPIEALSYGQRKRVTIASILISEPELLILDEPTAGQDYRNYTSMLNFIKALNHKLGITVLIVSHDMHLVLEYTTRSVVISDAKLIADAPVTDVFSQPALLDSANLAPTSLYELAAKAGIDNSNKLMRRFISQSTSMEVV